MSTVMSTYWRVIKDTCEYKHTIEVKEHISYITCKKYNQGLLLCDTLTCPRVKNALQNYDIIHNLKEEGITVIDQRTPVTHIEKENTPNDEYENDMVAFYDIIKNGEKKT